MAKQIPIDPRIISQLAKATVKNLIDGIVELVTNSDDSYRRGPDNNLGRIIIRVKRRKGGKAELLVVEDFAQGMSQIDLGKALIFAGDTSGFGEGKSVRGYFGRGLKETIIALGVGDIESIKNGQLSKTTLWHDGKQALYDDNVLAKGSSTSKASGTKVEIRITNDRIKIPSFTIFYHQLCNHFALRDILSNDEREIWIEFSDSGDKSKEKLFFSLPKGKSVLHKTVSMVGYSDQISLNIYESPVALTSPRNDPAGLAGILIKTQTATIDNQLFRFENEPAGLYFFGEAVCPGLEKRLREGQSELIDPNRGGLEKNHDYCKSLVKAIEDAIAPLVSEKKRELEGESKPHRVNDSAKKLLRDLCVLLNDLANGELGDDGGVTIPEYLPIIKELMIKPEHANIAPHTSRSFTIYAPDDLVSQSGSSVSVKSESIHISLSSHVVHLEKITKERKSVWVKSFSASGVKQDVESNIFARLGDQVAIAKVKIAPLGERKKSELTGQRSGFIRSIEINDMPNPTQRVVYRSGIIEIYSQFPSVRKFISGSLDEIENIEGRLLLAELVGEAFCRQVAIRGLEQNRFPNMPGDPIGSYNTAFADLQKKYLHKIQEVIFVWKF